MAKRDAGPDSHLPNVRITPVANGRIQAADQVSDCAQILDNGAPSRGYNLLLRANGKTYVVFPRKAENRDLRGSVVVCGIEDNQIRSIEIQAGFR